MKKISSLLFVFTIFICISFQRPLNDDSCKIMRNGTFVYGNPSSEVKVVIKGDKHIEYNHEGSTSSNHGLNGSMTASII